MIRSFAIFGFVALTVILAAALSIGSDVVTNHYTNVGEAHHDNLFGRGWLPDILPKSGRDIRVSNNLDLNTSEGAFSVAPSDLPAFLHKMTPVNRSAVPFVKFQKYADRMQKKGYASGAYSDDRANWVFFCKPSNGRCEYSMWLDRTKMGTSS